MTGYFYLMRGLFEHPALDSNQPFSPREAWIWLIEKANFADGQYRLKSQVFPIPRGSFAGSYRSIAKRWRWSPDRVIRELKLWEKQGMVELETRHGYLHITLSKYEQYQARPNTDATPTRQQQDTDATQTSTNQKKEMNERKEKKEDTVAGYPPEFEELWRVYPPHFGRKVGAFKIYQKARKGTSHGPIIEGARKFAQFVGAESRSDSKRYTPHLSTWLNDRGWDTNYDAPQRPSKPGGDPRTGGDSKWDAALFEYLERSPG